MSQTKPYQSPILIAQVSSPVGIVMIKSSPLGITHLTMDNVLDVPDAAISIELLDSTVIDNSTEEDLELAKSYLLETIEQLINYFNGSLEGFNLTLSPKGTAFQQQVWQALSDIPFGSSCSYSDIANKIGRPNAVRAVGAANGANPIAIVVPCHRVIGKNGKLTGYAHGLAMKQFLLDLELQA